MMEVPRFTITRLKEEEQSFVVLHPTGPVCPVCKNVWKSGPYLSFPSPLDGAAYRLLVCNFCGNVFATKDAASSVGNTPPEGKE